MKRRKFIQTLAAVPMAAALPLIAKPAYQPLKLLPLTIMAFNDVTLICPFFLTRINPKTHFPWMDTSWLYLSDEPGGTPWYECKLMDCAQTKASWMRLMRTKVKVDGQNCELPLGTNITRYAGGVLWAKECDRGYIWTQTPPAL